MDPVIAPIEHSYTDSGGRFYIDGQAQLSYRFKGKDTIIVDHTTVERQYRRHGVAARLYTHMVEYARDNQLQVVPVCSYIERMFDKHPEDADILAVG
jgi:hypothetical protein